MVRLAVFLILCFSVPFSFAESNFNSNSNDRNIARRYTRNQIRRNRLKVRLKQPAAKLTPRGGMMILSGYQGWNVGGEFTFRASKYDPLYLGVESGYAEFGFEDGSKVTMIPILATVMYRLERGRRRVFHPYIGVSGGVALLSGEGRPDPDQLVEGLGEGIHPAVLIRPGTEIGSRKASFGIEPRLGFIGGQFIFMPQVGLAIAF